MISTLRHTAQLFTLLAIFMGGSLFSQEARIDRANKRYNNLSFVDAIAIYEDVADSGYRSEELFRRLGNAYYFNSRYAEAAKWYSELFSDNGNQPAIYSLRYSQSLQSTGDLSGSKRYYDVFMSNVESKGGTLGGSRDYLEIIEENSGRYDLSALGSNSEGIDYGGWYMNDSTLVFASTRDTVSLIKRRSSWDGLSFLDLYRGNINSDGQLSGVEKLDGDINTRYHESTAAFTKDGSTIYFTRNAKASGGDNGNIIHLKLYRASLVDGDWTDVEELSINGENFSTAHPSLSADGGRLYFVSDRPEAIGQTDIFYCDIDSEGNLGRVFNAGGHINTAGRESFPFVTDDNELYFSSDGHYGLGGYDVFYVQLDDGSSSSLLNVGRPINTAFDDFSYIIREGHGYVSSNRPSGEGTSYDNIYAFVENEPIQNLLASRIFGTVTDSDTGAVIPGARIRILDSSNKVVAELSSDPDGGYEHSGLDRGTDYIVQFLADGYENGELFSKSGELDREHDMALVPVPEVSTDKGEVDLAILLNVKIYFDLDSAVIRPDAEVELQKVVSAMRLYPDIHVDVRSHTDSRASDAYNMALSQRRAESTVSYLVGQGIDGSRLTGRGYGETELVNGCVNGVPCSEAEQQANRRSEFIVERK